MLPKELFRAIRARHAKREPLNLSAVKRAAPDLVAAAFAPRPFLGWRGALEAARLSYHEIVVRLEEEVECLICRRWLRSLGGAHLATHGTTTDEYRTDFPGAETMAETLLARITGVSVHGPIRLLYPHWEPVWTLEYALDRLHYIYRAGHPCHVAALHDTEPGLFGVILKFFGSLDAAVTQLGLDPAAVRRGKSWNRRSEEELLSELRAYREKRLGNLRTAVDYDPRLTERCRRRFGSMEAALEKIGLTGKDAQQRGPRKFPPSMREEILAAARELGARKQAGVPLSRGERRAFQARYVGPVFALFKNWTGLAAAAGVPLEAVTYRCLYTSAQDVLAALRLRQAQGEPVSGGPVLKENRTLYFSARRFFGTYAGAAEALCAEMQAEARRAFGLDRPSVGGGEA